MMTGIIISIVLVALFIFFLGPFIFEVVEERWEDWVYLFQQFKKDDDDEGGQV